MREHFKELAEWLQSREDFFHRRLDTDEMEFDMKAMLFEVESFALEFERRLN